MSVSQNGTIIAEYVYDGDGNRVMKTEGGETVLYINRYFEVNLSASTNTSYYYLGGTLVAMSANNTLSYIHQDHLSGTTLVTSDNGTAVESLKYYSYGLTRELTGPEITDKLLTGQRLDGTGLYFYGARYYDPLIGRFISPDTIIPNPANPQSFNRYTYCLNNPLKYIDPSGHKVIINGVDVTILYGTMSLNDPRLFSYIEEYTSTPLFQEYNAFRNLDDTSRTMAASMENSVEYNVYFVVEETDYKWHKPSERDGNDFTVKIHPDTYYGYDPLSLHAQALDIRDAIGGSKNPILKTKPDYDWWSVVGAGLQNAIPAKKWPASLVVAALDTGIRPNQLLSNMVGFATGIYSTPLSITWGVFSDLLRQQDFYDWCCVQAGSYPFVD